MSKLREELREVLNRNCAENGSDTPDFILAEYLMDCLESFDKTVKARSKWYGHHCNIAGCNHGDEPTFDPNSDGLYPPMEKYEE